MDKASSSIPDAWDDDWETQADQSAHQEDQTLQSPAAAPKSALTKADRLNLHAEANRKLWESADSPQTFHYLEASSNVPLTSTFKPQVKVLSRKPVTAKRVAGRGIGLQTANGGHGDNDDDDDDDDDDKKEAQLSPEEIRAKQKRDREEKQRRYDEARAKIFGSSAPSSRGSSPGTVTPPLRQDGRQSAPGRPRGRGGAQRMANGARQQLETRRTTNQAPPPPRELYDPNYSSRLRRPPEDGLPRRSPPLDEPQAAIRAPRGPDGSGRGGFGFARRGARDS